MKKLICVVLLAFAGLLINSMFAREGSPKTSKTSPKYGCSYKRTHNLDQGRTKNAKPKYNNHHKR